MAFRQPTFHAPQRTYQAPPQSRSDVASPLDAPLDDSQEWILFSPSPASASGNTLTTASRQTQTLGHSRNSAFGSLDTAARSYDYDEAESEHTEGAIEDEEDGELDSLDSHLQEFRAEPSVYQDEHEILQSSNPVLPTHDGLGSFRINQTAMGEGVQQHLYAFEQYNPRRIKRRRESLELGQLELERERQTELDRTQRIEAWRLEQSKALLEEIQKESRRRKYSMGSERRSLLNENDAETASMAGDPRSAPDNENESFWSRITRRVIQDLMGIDDNTLSILFGESLPLEAELAKTPTTSDLAQINDMKKDSWEYRLLDRVARELGLLIHHLSDHPGVFSTYVQAKTQPLPYAGLPIIPEAMVQSSDLRHSSRLETSTSPQFHPTMQPQTAAIDIPKLDDHTAMDIDATPRPGAPIHNATAVEFTKDEWEKQLDIKMVFRYLRSRFTSRSSSPEPPLHTSLSSPDLLKTPHPHTDQARAARVRQHHPLVSRNSRTERRTFKVSIPSGGVASGLHSPILQRRSSSSCASVSGAGGKVLGVGKSRHNGSGSSRHYWDLGGSLGSGSLVASGGGLGAWGEV